jgi:phosphoribosyl 1,2-cyclic phosphodiesterase
MELVFLGTRGEIDVRSRLHRRHSALLIERCGARIMIDCGADWLGQLDALAPTAIVLTHAHPDHAFGLAHGATCPVYATEASWDLLHHFPIKDRRMVPLNRSFAIAGVSFRAVPVMHSVRAPAVGYRVSADGGAFFYAPDIAAFADASKALARIDVYIGDGAIIKRSMVRLKHGALIGHAPIAAQLGWCAKAKIQRAIFTHCGTPIVRGSVRALDRLIRELGREHGIDASLARDDDRLSLPLNGAKQERVHDHA